jgi:hypothetical protein
LPGIHEVADSSVKLAPAEAETHHSSPRSEMDGSSDVKPGVSGGARDALHSSPMASKESSPRSELEG